jgi:hypothetical protein
MERSRRGLKDFVKILNMANYYPNHFWDNYGQTSKKHHFSSYSWLHLSLLFD